MHVAAALAVTLVVTLAPLTRGAVAAAPDPVRFGLDWTAEAEYGGFYQAWATGLYARNGLDVTIEQGGPQVNQTQKLLGGRLDLAITSNSLLALNFVRQGIPFRAVAAIFQKDPSVLIAHAGQGNDSFAALKGKPIMISGDTRAGWWEFLKARFGYTDAQIRPYTFNLQPFVASNSAIQQGSLGSEPLSIEQATGQKPVVLLIADAGYQGYASLIETSDKMIAEHPDIVARFVDASIQGWYSYLNGDPAPANAAIKRANPEMTDALLAYGRDSLRAHDMLESGDAATLGIGAMTPTRWRAFYDEMAAIGLYPKGMDYQAAYTTRFVDKAVGVAK